MILTEAEALERTKKIMSLCHADSCLVTLDGFDQRHVRFAQNMATTSGAPSGVSITVEAHYGQKSGSATGTDFDDAALKKLVAQAEDTAQRAPANPEFMAPLGPQQYLSGTAFFPSTRDTSSAALAAAVHPVMQEAAAKNLQSSGFLQTNCTFSSLATSKGLWVYDQGTDVLHTVTARTPDGTGAGWAGTTFADFNKMDAPAMGRVAIDKAYKSRHPQPLPPGKYTVILEPSAVADLMAIMISDFDARAADEGRSFATKKGGGSRLGEKMFNSDITITSDPHNALVPGGIFSDDGQPTKSVDWIKNGVLTNLQCSRYWAKKTKRDSVPTPTTVYMNGGTQSTADLIRQVKRGLLVTRFWYIRQVDPQTELLTGLTRDGVFLIEGGEITRPVCNFRFNESPVAMLNRVIAMGPSVRAYGEEVVESGNFPISVPPLLVDEFDLTSISDAV